MLLSVADHSMLVGTFCSSSSTSILITDFAMLKELGGEDRKGGG
jgi:hypothetical protein